LDTSSPTKSSTTPSPTSRPTRSPTRLLTRSPTNAPTEKPTDSPTAIPTDKPTENPTATPTKKPTNSPSDSPTLNPTNSPSDTPTSSPSALPTEKANENPLITQTIPGLSIALQPLTALNQTGVSAFEEGTDTYYDYYYNRINSESFSNVQMQVSDVTVQTKVTSQNPSYNGRRLQMQQIMYEQRVSYRLRNNGNVTVTSKDIVMDAMNSKAKRDVYLITLQVQSPETFEAVDTVYMPEFSQPSQDSSSPTNPPPAANSGPSVTTIAILSVVCAILLLICVLCSVWFYRKRMASSADKISGSHRLDEEDFEARGVSVSPEVEVTDRQNTNIRVPSSNYVDEVSTLAEPMPRLGVMSSSDISYAGYEDKSIATVDYDYSKAYGGNNSFTASSFSRRQQSQPSPPSQQPHQSSFSVFSDDASFDAHYQEPYKEHTIEVLAPAGKLGVVIDTPDEGAPIVHAIKETSCVADKLKVGDKLLRVDEEDVTAMTAIKVSKLISRKSANAVRKLTIVRTVVNDD